MANWQGTAGFPGAGGVNAVRFFHQWTDSAIFSGVGSHLLTYTGILDQSPQVIAGSGTLSGDARQRHWLAATGSVSAAGVLAELVYQNYRTNPASFTASDSALVTITYGAYLSGAVFSAFGELDSAVVLTLPISGSLSGAGVFSGDSAAVHNWTGTASYSASGILVVAPSFATLAPAALSASGALSGTSAVLLPAAGAFLGNGQLFSNLNTQWPGSGSLSVDGGLAAADTLTLPTGGSLAAAATLATTSKLTLPASALLAAGGTLSASVTLTLPASGVFSASATLAPAYVSALPASSSFNARGTFTSSNVLTLPIGAAVSSAGQLAAVDMMRFAGNMALSGGGVIAATMFGPVVARAAFSGSGSVGATFFSRAGPPQHWDDVHRNANISSGPGPLGSLIMNANNIYAPAYANEGVTNGKKYWEVTVSLNPNDGIGIGTINSSINDGQYLGGSSDTLGLYLFGGNPGSAEILVSGFTQAVYDVSWVYGDLYAFAVDFDNSLLWVRNISEDSSWYGSDVGDPASGINGFSLTQPGFTITSAPIVPAISLYYNNDTAAGYFAPVEWSGVPPVGFDAFDYKFTRGGSFQAEADFAGTAVAVHEVSAAAPFVASGGFGAAITVLWQAGPASFAATGSSSLVTLAAVSAAVSLPASGQFTVLETVAHADLRFAYASFSASGSTALSVGIFGRALPRLAGSAVIAVTGLFVHPTVFAAFAGSGSFAAQATLPLVQVSFAAAGGFSMPKPTLELIVTPSAPSLTNPQLGDHVAYLNGQRWDGRAFDGNFIFVPPHWDYPNAGTVGGCGAGVFAIVQPDGAGTQAELIINPAGPGVGTLSGPITDYATIEAADPAVSQFVGFAGAAAFVATATNLGGNVHAWQGAANFTAGGALAAMSIVTFPESASFGAAAAFVSAASVTLPASALFAAVGVFVSTAAVTLPTSGSFGAAGSIIGSANMALPQSAIFAASGNVSGSITQAFLAAFPVFSGYAEIDAQPRQAYSLLPSFSGNAAINSQSAQNYSINQAIFNAVGNIVAVSSVLSTSASASFINDSWFSVKENAALPGVAALAASGTFSATPNVNMPVFAALLASVGFVSSVSVGLFPLASFAGAAALSAQLSSPLLGTTARFAAASGLQAGATLSVQQEAVFVGNAVMSAQPILAVPALASVSGAGTISVQSFGIQGTYWVGAAQFAGAASLSAIAGVVSGTPLSAGFDARGGFSGQLLPIIDLTDIGVTQTSSKSVRWFFYTGINVTIDPLEPGTLILALDFDPLPPSADLRIIAYESMGLPDPSFAGVTAIWDYGGTNQVMTRVQSLPSPAVPSPPGLGDFTIAFILENPAPGNLELLISWTDPSAQVSAYAVTYGHGIPGTGPAPVAPKFAETDFHVNLGRFLNRRRVLVE